MFAYASLVSFTLEQASKFFLLQRHWLFKEISLAAFCLLNLPIFPMGFFYSLYLLYIENQVYGLIQFSLNVLCINHLYFISMTFSSIFIILIDSQKFNAFAILAHFL